MIDTKKELAIPLTPSTQRLIGYIAIIFLALAVFFFKVGDNVLLDYDEATYASVVKSTAELSNPLTLTIGPEHQPWFVKPPLMIWSAMITRKYFAPDELAVRMPVALLGVISIIVVMLTGYEMS